MFADRAYVQPVAGLEEREADDRDQHDHQVEEARLVEEDRPDDRDLAEQRNRQVGREVAGVEVGVRREHLMVEVRRETAEHRDEHDADDDLVGLVAQREEREQQADRAHR